MAEAASALDAFDADVVAGGAVVAADVLEAAAASDLADAVSVVAADAIEAATALDGFEAVAVFAVAVDEPASALDEVVAAVGAQVLFGTVDEAAVAVDQLDAAVVGEAVSVPGGGGVGVDLPRRPFPVVGYGFGILPQLEGEAHGVVGAVGKSAAQFVVRAEAVGACGQAGNAAVVLKGLSVAGKGAIGTRGAGAGMIVKFSGTATGRHDDDEAAVIAILLAA